MSRPAAPLISVVVTCYNHRKYIGEAVRSILDQTVSDLELIVVDDGSTDGSWSVLTAFDDPRVRLVRQPNSGPSAAVNSGLAQAHGTFVALMSGDDVSMPYRLTQQLDQIARGLDLVFSKPRLIDERSQPVAIYRHPAFFKAEFKTETDLYAKLFRLGNFLCGSSAFGRAEVFQRVGAFHPGLVQMQDFDYWIRACRSGVRIGFFADPVVRYRVRDGGLNLSDGSHRRRYVFEAVRIYTNYFDEAPFKLLRDAFPDEVNARAEASSVARVVDQLFLYLSHDSALVRSVGTQHLLQAICDPSAAAELDDRGFRPPEIFRLMSETEPYAL